MGVGSEKIAEALMLEQVGIEEREAMALYGLDGSSPGDVAIWFATKPAEPGTDPVTNHDEYMRVTGS